MTGEKAADHILDKPRLARSNQQPWINPRWEVMIGKAAGLRVPDLGSVSRPCEHTTQAAADQQRDVEHGRDRQAEATGDEIAGCHSGSNFDLKVFTPLKL